MKHSLNREELIEQLKELAAQKLPTYLANHMGAMCYEPSMIDHCCLVKIVKYHLSSNSRNSFLDIQTLI